MSVVFTKTETILYINGEEKARQNSAYDLREILGSSSILYIGKANWQSGEYYKGLIDNCLITSYAMTEEEIRNLYQEEEPDPEPEKPLYVDVAETDWFYDAVAYTYLEGLMTGLDETHFGPYDTLSRAQFALISYLMEGKLGADTEKTFGDIAGDKRYGPAVIWAAENNIVSGYENGNFGPSDLITREQMAVMMYRYAKYMGADTSKTTAYDGFEDAGNVSAFAEVAMGWAIGSDIIKGKEEGTKIDPQGNTARCETAIIIKRFKDK